MWVGGWWVGRWVGGVDGWVGEWVVGGRLPLGACRGRPHDCNDCVDEDEDDADDGCEQPKPIMILF